MATATKKPAKKAPAKKAAPVKKSAAPKLKIVAKSKEVVAAKPVKKSLPLSKPKKAIEITKSGPVDTAVSELAPKAPASNTSNIKLIDNVTLPPRVRLTNASPYPFAAMSLGQSFLIEAEVIDGSKYSVEKEARKAQSEACGVVANRLGGAIRRFTKNNADYGFKLATVTNGKSLGFEHDIGVVVQRTK